MTKKNKKKVEENIVGIPCKWVKIKKSKIGRESDDEKCGVYSQTNHNISGFGIDRWVVSAYIEVDYKSLMNEGMTEEEIAEGCAAYLSVPPPRKKYQKKEPKPLYGKLEPLLAPWRGVGKYSVKPKKGHENRLIIEFITDERKNKNFWGEGPNFLGTKTPKKPGRKKKEKKK